ncbi:DUF6440 family protein [Paenibacillus sp. SI8]|uniref:DUF6440 family protein n=1 Tax=unclassified Paenibacillus TaxID=185978 RepID=UPI0034660B5F
MELRNIFQPIIGLFLMSLLIIGGLFGLSYLVDGFKEAQADMDAKSRFVSVNENGIKTVTDKETGCKYIQGIWDTALTPMLDEKAQPVCGK